MYRSISENYDKQKRKTHEYKNQISCIEALVKKNQFTKVEEYVKGIYSRLDKELDAIDTNNVIVNAIYIHSNHSERACQYQCNLFWRFHIAKH